MDAASQTGGAASAGRSFVEGATGGLSMLVDELAYGVLLTTTRGRLQHANLAARRELAARKVLVLQEGQVQTADAGQSRLLMHALGQAQAGRRSLVALRSTSTRLSIAVVPLRSGTGDDAPAVAMIFSRRTVCDAVMLCFFARAHGLTPSEEQILAILCQGYSAPEIALQLKVAVSTVRSHIRSLCAKTHSNGVRTLVGQIAVLPPIGVAYLQDPLH